MHDKFLHHVTLTTGDIRRSYRSEVSDDAVEWARHVIYVGTIRNEIVPLAPIGQDIRLQFSPPENRATLKCVVLRVTEPILTFGIASHTKHGDALWQDLVDTATTPIVEIDRPREPWIAVRLELGAAKVGGEAMMMIADMQRCIGWGYLERT